MSSAESFRDYINERLTAAAEEIYRAFLKCVAEDKEEIARLRRLLDIVWKPEITLNRIELPQHVLRENEVRTDHQFGNKEKKSKSTKDQEDPQPPQVLEEQEEFCTGQEEEEQHTSVPKEETDTFMLTPTDGETDIHEDQMLDLNPGETLSAAQEECVVNHAEITFVVGAPDIDLEQPANTSHVADGQGDPREKDLNINSKSQIGQKLNVCPVCGRSFKGKAGFRSHMKTHEGETPFVCKTCGKQFRKSYLLNGHMKNHKYYKKFICETCGKCFSKNRYLEVHMRTHNVCKPYICGTCGKGFRSDYWKIHVKTHTSEKPNLCKKCGKQCTGECHSKVHVKTHTSEIPYICKTCGRRFKNKKSFDSHIRTHTGEKRFVCKPCGKYFTKRKALKKHTRKYHPGEKEGVPADLKFLKHQRSFIVVQENPETPHVIEGQEEICTSLEGEQRVLTEETDTFMLNPDVENHTNGDPTPDLNPDETLNAAHEEPVIPYVFEAPKTAQYTDERPHVCTRCGRSYKRIRDLKMHLKTHAAEMPFMCKICRKQFRKVYLLHKHVKSHIPKMIHSCEICGERFSRSGTLEAHIRTHNVLKPLICETCGKGCSTKHDLRIHKRTHTNENPYICKTCGEQFRRSRHLKIHMRVDHPGGEEEDPADQEFLNQEMNFNMDQENPDTPQVIEEQREVTSLEGEQLVLKETDTVMLTRTNGESDNDEDQTLDSRYETAQEESAVNGLVISSVVGELHHLKPLFNISHVADSQGQKGQHENPGSDTESKPSNEQHKGKSHDKIEYKQAMTQTNVKREEEIDPQSRLLDVAWKPIIKLHQIELPQQQVCKEEEGLTDKEVCNKERKSTVDQQDPQAKDQQEEVCTSQVFLKETNIFMVTPTNEEDDNNEDQTSDLNPYDTRSAAQKGSVGNNQVMDSVVGTTNSDLHLLANIFHLAETQDQIVKPCEIDLKFGENAYICNACGKHFACERTLNTHMMEHTGTKPHICKQCGKSFAFLRTLKNHMRTHKDMMSYMCGTCGKRLAMDHLQVHFRTHTEKKQHICKQCGKHLQTDYSLQVHMRTHTGENPYTCETCGKYFRDGASLRVHVRTHTGEKPYICETCGKRYRQSSGLKYHMRNAHTGEQPYVRHENISD